jgi:predicted metalloenzyme YecM
MADIYKLLGDVNGFLEKIISALDADKINVSKYELDHVCYRVKSQDEYEQFKSKLSHLGELLTEIEIGERLISTYKLKEPINFRKRKIYLVELPSPKKDSPYPKGLEHVEFVIQDNFEDFMRKHPNIKFDTSGIGKLINPDIKIKYPKFSVKFHNKPLEYVIKYEQ